MPMTFYQLLSGLHLTVRPTKAASPSAPSFSTDLGTDHQGL
jgi:hypothetical protein